MQEKAKKVERAKTINISLFSMIKLLNFLNKHYKFNIKYHLSDQNYLDLSNKLLQRVIGKYKFISAESGLSIWENNKLGKGIRVD